MKRIYTIITGLCVLAISAYAQTNEQTRNLDNFEAVSVGESIQVTLVQGEKNEAVVMTDGVSVDKVLTEIKGNTLNIHMDRGSYGSQSVDVVLTYSEDLREIRCSSSAVVKSASEIESNELYVQCSSSGTMILILDVERLKLEVSSSGKVTLSGEVSTQDIEVSSSGKYHGVNLKSKGARVKVSSSGKATVDVSRELSATVSSSGKVTYHGDPETVDIDTSSSGKVHKG
ncbi:hypothetical protein BFP72_08270 [Reichenbachiella sp. 5M10]|uniref:head GIN domain-containing protein n=1 Tax=Reichenbachiella sp. 5M10 TaxID=1889772 RepID=UPI000C14FDA4|nr:head GIN domain-containing protein [Reichenbachiella sp. 5M10]PIB35391.1 hypothetical protein BFP72_08270 [Reichenbachiella sp. 5M10]